MQVQHAIQNDRSRARNLQIECLTERVRYPPVIECLTEQVHYHFVDSGTEIYYRSLGAFPGTYSFNCLHVNVSPYFSFYTFYTNAVNLMLIEKKNYKIVSMVRQ